MPRIKVETEQKREVDMAATLAHITIEPTAKGTKVWVQSDHLEKVLKGAVEGLAEAKRLRETEKEPKVKVWNVSLQDLLGAEVEDRVFVNFSGGYLEEDGCFNMVPLLLQGTSSKEGAAITLGPSNKTQRTAYKTALTNAFATIFNNVMAAPRICVKISVENWDEKVA